ncbi:hypothetical protein BH23ACT10_BH23ACT10_13480 [soil metagenome]
MTHTTHRTIPYRRTGGQFLAAATIIAIIVSLTAVVAQRTDDTASTRTAQAPHVTGAAAPEGLTAYARAHNLTGLSPAGLTRRDGAAVSSSDPIAVYEVYRDIARYANAHGLTGLSPASLAQSRRIRRSDSWSARSRLAPTRSPRWSTASYADSATGHP